MADADEDHIIVARNEDDGIDLSDETQDFRFLAAFDSLENAKIPKRGEKDFEPYDTTYQFSALEASRAAMHAALSVPRVHHPKNHILGRFDASTCMVVVDRPKGPHFRTIGRAKGLKVWLLPEEALYLVERGSLDVRWPVSGDGADDDDEDVDLNKDGTCDEVGRQDEREKVGRSKQVSFSVDADEQEGIPMSLQGAYTAFLGMQSEGPEKLTLEQYVVYTSLKRLGYIVMRSKQLDDYMQTRMAENERDEAVATVTRDTLFSQLWEGLFGSRYPTDSGRESISGSLVKPGLYRSYDDIYKLLQIDLSGKPAASYPTPPDPFTITYDVYKPSASFRKSNPGRPDFRICVLDGRESSVPSLLQLTHLMAQMGKDFPRPNAQLYNRLKHGKSHVILAIVDQGVVSYMRVSEAGFADERIYEGRGRGSGRGGKGRGRKRGRQRRGGR